MWKSRRIAAAQDCCKKHERKQQVRQEEEEKEDAGGGDGGEEEEEEEEEKAKLFISVACQAADGLCHRGRGHGSCYGLPSKAMARDLSSSLRAFLASTLRRLPAITPLQFRRCISAAYYAAHTAPVCFPFRSAVPFPLAQEDPISQETRAQLVGVGIHLRAAALHAHRKFTLEELRAATSHFAEKNVLGKGSSGCVYRGKLAPSGLAVAVKALNTRSKEARMGFATEIEIMCHVQDLHIQPLLGYCIEDGHLLLVYIYMPRGSLEAWLHGKCKPALLWNDRHKVAIGITKALHYLHTGCKPPVIHRDVKASNILLTNSNNPKLSDFGLAIRAPFSNSISKEIMGTFGYLAPEYFQYGKVSTKIDIYSLGVVLLELMTGRRPIDRDAPFGEGNLANWARHLICNTRGYAEGLADPELRASYSSTGMRKLLCIAALCIHPVDTKRPSISKVLAFMQKEPAGRLHWLVMEAYASCSPLSWELTVSKDQNKDLRKSQEDLRRKYLEMAMLDVDERSSLLHSPLTVL